MSNVSPTPTNPISNVFHHIVESTKIESYSSDLSKLKEIQTRILDQSTTRCTIILIQNSMKDCSKENAIKLDEAITKATNDINRHISENKNFILNTKRIAKETEKRLQKLCKRQPNNTLYQEMLLRTQTLKGQLIRYSLLFEKFVNEQDIAIKLELLDELYTSINDSILHNINSISIMHDSGGLHNTGLSNLAIELNAIGQTISKGKQANSHLKIYNKFIENISYLHTKKLYAAYAKITKNQDKTTIQKTVKEDLLPFFNKLQHTIEEAKKNNTTSDIKNNHIIQTARTNIDTYITKIQQTILSNKNLQKCYTLLSIISSVTLDEQQTQNLLPLRTKISQAILLFKEDPSSNYETILTLSDMMTQVSILEDENYTLGDRALVIVDELESKLTEAIEETIHYIETEELYQAYRAQLKIEREKKAKIEAKKREQASAEYFKTKEQENIKINSAASSSTEPSTTKQTINNPLIDQSASLSRSPAKKPIQRKKGSKARNNHRIPTNQTIKQPVNKNINFEESRLTQKHIDDIKRYLKDNKLDLKGKNKALLEQCLQDQKRIMFKDLEALCIHLFDAPKNIKGSHFTFKKTDSSIPFILTKPHGRSKDNKYVLPIYVKKMLLALHKDITAMPSTDTIDFDLL